MHICPNKDDQRKGENEKIREFERIRELGSEEKKEGREDFVERKERGVMKNMKRWGRWREWRRREEKKRLVTVEENEKVGTHLMAKLHVV